MTLASDARSIVRAGIRAVDPTLAVRSQLRRAGRGVRVGGTPLVPDTGGRLLVLGLGKAAAAMADEAVRRVGRDLEGVVAVPRGYPIPRSGVTSVVGEHPVPGEGSFRAGRALRQAVLALTPKDRVVFLISGGGSSAAEVPVAPLLPREISRTTQALLASGAPIQAMNAVRRHLSQLKGGRWAASGAMGGFATIAISDVVGDHPSDIASGPTVPDPTTFGEALRVVQRYDLRRSLPSRVLRFLEEGAHGRHPETPKPGDPRFRSAQYVFGATNRLALVGAATEARLRGYEISVAREAVTGATQGAARRFARALRRLGTNGRHALLAGGETTVTLGRHPGRGGRNQEFALAAALELTGHPGLLVLSAGTDGVDGPTDAAGGWGDGETLAHAARLGVDLRRALDEHSAYDALRELGSLWRTGPTGTNVMDLHVGLAAGPGGVSPGRVQSSRPGGAPSSRRRRS